MAVQYFPLQSKNILNQVKAPSMPFEWSINPYRGCQHGCSFCYARSTHSFLGAETDDTFQKQIFIKENASDALRRQIEQMLKSKRPAEIGKVAIGTATDPYQPIEAKAELTRRCLEILAEYRILASITTRSPLVLRDIDLLRKIPSITVNFSINTMNFDTVRRMEPATSHPLKRLESVKQLVGEGIQSGIFLAPILPWITDSESELEATVKTASEHDAQFVMSSYLRLSTNEVKVWYFKTLSEHYPHLSEAYARLFEYSAYVPDHYRKPKEALIQGFIRKYQIKPKEAFLKKQTNMEIENQPEQLHFSF
jgi:DNA repair photolyase